MGKAIEYLRTHPVMAGAVGLLVVGIVFFYVTAPRPQQPTSPAGQPAAPGPAASPAMPAPAASPQPPAAQAPAPAASPAPRAAAPVDAGRPDPFAPIIRPPGPMGQPGFMAPPPAPLPPPLFPGQQPGAPPAPPSPTPPPKDAAGASLVGLVGDNGGVAIIRLGNETFIVSQGDLIKSKIRVTVIDVTKSIVILEEEGERFELRMGGVSGRHVAA